MKNLSPIPDKRKGLSLYLYGFSHPDAKRVSGGVVVSPAAHKSCCTATLIGLKLEVTESGTMRNLAPVDSPD